MINAVSSMKRKLKDDKKRLAAESAKELSPFDKIFSKMTLDEQYEYACLSIIGQHDIRNKVVFVSPDLMDKITAFQDKMVAKYC